jgi:hypothetical protein
MHLKDRYGEPERASEWEPITILLEGDGDSYETNTASNTRLRLTTKVGQAHAAIEVLLDLGTNKQPSKRKLAHQHAQRKLARLAACAAPVRPMACAGQTGDTGQTGGQRRSGRWLQQPHNKESLSDFSRP